MTVPTDRDDLDDRCRLLGGATTWRTHDLPALGAPELKMSDGPNGVRGELGVTDVVRGVAVPVGIALGATWDPALVERIGRLLAAEAHRKGAHVLLGPTVNLVRMPTGGRAFECYSEDPELTARLGVAWIRGVQSGGIATTVKHFVGNDTEIDRLSVDVHADPAVLRELYLRPFEAAVTEAGAWGIMSAYNRVDGRFCAEHRWLLTDLLRGEWGFDGVVVSDWGGAHDTVGAATGGLTIAMPGPTTVFGPALAEAVRDGRVDRAAVDARVAEIALLAERTRAFELSADRPQQCVDDPAERALCRDAAVSGIVLARNTPGALPLDGTGTIAVIGPNARTTRIMGGGSSALRPVPAASVLEALTERFGERVVGHTDGAVLDKLMPVLTGATLRTPSGEPGLRVEVRNGTDVGDRPTGEPIATDVAPESALLMFGQTVPGQERMFTVTLTGEIVPDTDGTYEIGAVVAGGGRVTVGETVLIDDPDRRLPRGDYLFGMGSEEQLGRIEARAGVPIPLRIATTGRDGGAAARFGMRIVHERPPVEAAVELAATADVAVVVVGTTDEWETEGHDRDDLALPGEQDELVRRVAAVAGRTVVVVNAGGPVAMPWLDDVDAVLIASFAGIETGPAVAAVLAGDADPGGRLPVTYPKQLADTPAFAHYLPVDGVQTYGEGRLMGYRGFVAHGVDPLLPFGHGLSFGTSVWEPARLSADRIAAGQPLTVSVPIVNTGDRPVTDVVQVYVSHPHPDMAPQTLAGFAKAVTAPGATTVVDVELGDVAWRRWDTATDGWVVDPGPRDLLVARSATDIVERLPVTISGDGPA